MSESGMSDSEFYPKPALKNGMDNVIAQVELAYQQIRDERDRLAGEQAAIKKLRERIRNVSANAAERMKINVGGQKFEIRMQSCEKNTFFRSLATGAFTAIEPDGTYFIDEDQQYVHLILAKLREENVNLSRYTKPQLRAIRKEAEFYMIPELVQEIDLRLDTKYDGSRTIQMNCEVPENQLRFFNGVFMEIVVGPKPLSVASIAFRAGEKRRLVAEAFLGEGTMAQLNYPNALRHVGEVESDVADRGDNVVIRFDNNRPLELLANTTYVFGVYSSSCPTALQAVSKARATRDFMQAAGFYVTHSFHTTNPRGDYMKRAGEDQYDFVGEIALNDK